MLHERTLFLKKEEKRKKEKRRQKRIKQERQEKQEREENITTPVYEVRSVSELIKSIPLMPKLT
jgi:hypothetical protein